MLSPALYAPTCRVCPLCPSRQPWQPSRAQTEVSVPTRAAQPQCGHLCCAGQPVLLPLPHPQGLVSAGPPALSVLSVSHRCARSCWSCIYGYMCPSVCLCTCASKYICICVTAHACLSAVQVGWIYLHIGLSMCRRVYVHVIVYTCGWICLYMWVCLHVHVCGGVGDWVCGHVWVNVYVCVMCMFERMCVSACTLFLQAGAISAYPHVIEASFSL